MTQPDSPPTDGPADDHHVRVITFTSGRVLTCCSTQQCGECDVCCKRKPHAPLAGSCTAAAEVSAPNNSGSDGCHCGLGTRDDCATKPWGCATDQDHATPDAASQSRTTPDSPAAGGDAADNPGVTFTATPDGWRWDRPERPGQTEARGTGYSTEAEARADYAHYAAEDQRLASRARLEALCWPIDRLNPTNGQPWTDEEKRSLGIPVDAADWPTQLGTSAASPNETGLTVGATYFCPTSGDVESPIHGGFDTCCDRPDLHEPQPVATHRNTPDLRALIAAALEECRTLIPAVQADAVLAVVDAHLPERAQAAIRAAVEQVQVRDQQLAAVREYVRTSDDDGIRTREQVMRILGAAGGEVGP